MDVELFRCIHKRQWVTGQSRGGKCTMGILTIATLLLNLEGDIPSLHNGLSCVPNPCCPVPQKLSNDWNATFSSVLTSLNKQAGTVFHATKKKIQHMSWEVFSLTLHVLGLTGDVRLSQIVEFCNNQTPVHFSTPMERQIKQLLQ